jgi:hypothetical protein
MTAKLVPVWSVIPRPVPWPRDLGVKVFRTNQLLPSRDAILAKTAPQNDSFSLRNDNNPRPG